MAEIGFFPVDVDYYSEDDRAVIRLFGRTLDGDKICVLDRTFDPYFLVLVNPKDLDKVSKEIRKIKTEDHKVLDVKKEIRVKKNKEIDVLKIIVDHPSAVTELKSLISEIKGVESYEEADILFVRRYLIDKGITPLKLTNVKGNPISTELRVDICIEAEKVNPETEDFTNPKTLAFDIEVYTSGEAYPSENRDPIITLAFYGDNFSKIITWKKFKTDLDITFVDGESGLIHEFIKTIRDYNPDYLVGYFSDGFDLPYLKARAQKHKIPLDLGLDKKQVKISKKGNFSAKINGIAHIDILKFIRGIMAGSLQLDNYSLGEVSKNLIKDEKIDLDITKISDAWDNDKEIDKICEYNLQDARLTYKIFKEVLPNLEEIVKLVSQPVYDVCRMSYGQLIEWYLIKRCKEFNKIIPSKPKSFEVAQRRMRTYKGAFVFNPSPGLYENLVVLDFRSLYPSIIVAKNIDPETLTKNKKESYETPEIRDDTGEKVKYYFSYKEEGFIPNVIKDLISRRSMIKEIMGKEGKSPILEARSYGLKTILNSCYGYYGYFNARFYCRECSNSITSWGRHFIKTAIKDAEKEGFKAIYADTDSLFLCLEDKSKADAMDFLEKVNADLPSLMELDLEGFYPKGLFVMKKDESKGAKKKYALLDEKGKLKVTGFETVRRDWSYLAKEVQREVLEIVLIKGSLEEAFDYVRKVIRKVRDKKVDIEKMIIRTQLKKDIDSYDLVGPHVTVAKRMKEQGYPIGVGSMISYIVTEGSGLIRDRAKSLRECKEDDYSAEYYINNQILPSIKMIFGALGYSEQELIQSKDQSTLGDF